MKDQTEIAVGDVIRLLWENNSGHGERHHYPERGTIYRVREVSDGLPYVNGTNGHKIRFSPVHWEYYEPVKGTCNACTSDCKKYEICPFYKEYE